MERDRTPPPRIDVGLIREEINVARYHISPNGPRQCKAVAGRCPYGGPGEGNKHYDSYDEARTAFVGVLDTKIRHARMTALASVETNGWAMTRDNSLVESEEDRARQLLALKQLTLDVEQVAAELAAVDDTGYVATSEAVRAPMRGGEHWVVNFTAQKLPDGAHSARVTRASEYLDQVSQKYIELLVHKIPDGDRHVYLYDTSDPEERGYTEQQIAELQRDQVIAKAAVEEGLRPVPRRVNPGRDWYVRHAEAAGMTAAYAAKYADRKMRLGGVPFIPTRPARAA